MKRKNMARNALFTSVLSLLLCVSMLVGTTFAWFTDSVESGRNTIAAGNLDVELYADGKPVDSDTVLFDDVNPNLWEPGAMAYETLQVKNVGTLALQYTLTLNVLDETVVNGYKLSDVIKVGVIEGPVSREYIKANAAGWTTLDKFNFDQTAVKLNAKEASEAFTVVLYWAPNDNEIDNRYNMNNGREDVLKLDIGVSLIATQVMSEKDSFDDTYDGEATPWIGAIKTDWYFKNPDATSFEINTVDELAGLAAIVNGTATAPVTTFATEGETTTVQDSFKGKTVTLGSDIDLANATWSPIGTSAKPFQGTFDGGNHTISNLMVTGRGSNVGLFGYTTDGAVKNLTVHNASVSGRLNVAVVAGTPYTSTYSNITVSGHVEVNGLAYVGAVGGKNVYANWDNITVAVDDTSYVKADSVEKGSAYRTYVGGVIGFMGEGSHTVSNVTSNIDVFGSTCDVGGITGIAHYGNNFKNITCSGDVTITNATEADEAEEIGGIAGVWMNNTSDVTLTNCEFTGKLSTNYSVDLTNNTFVGKPYGATTSNKLIINGVEYLSKAADIDSALMSGENVVLGGNASVNVSDTAAANGYGKTGLQIKPGVTLDGNGNTLNVSGATGTWDSAVTVNGGTIKNITVASGFRGIFVANATEKVKLENVTVQGPTYTISCDQSNGHGLEATNSTFNGWTSYAATIGNVKFVNCSFGAGAGYNFSRPYAPTEYVNCNFAAGHKIDARAAVTFENCTIDGVALTAENLATLVTSNIANATIK